MTDARDVLEKSLIDSRYRSTKATAKRIIDTLNAKGLVIVPREPPHEWDDLTKRYYRQSVEVLTAAGEKR